MPKALLIVEGASLEPRFFTHLSKICGMDVEILSLRANVYLLYRKLKEYGFDYDVKTALKELLRSDADANAVLSHSFAYTYLVFDCDAHDSGIPRRGTPPRPLPDVVNENYSRLSEMQEYFTDETDPDRGLLYVNYPMMESYRDADSFSDPSFLNRTVSFADLRRYKELVGRRRLANSRIDRLDVAQLHGLMEMHLSKLERILERAQNADEAKMPSLVSPPSERQRSLLRAQRELSAASQMFVVNTSLLLPADYFGVDDLETLKWLSS